jgi:DNA-binding protein WhiA
MQENTGFSQLSEELRALANARLKYKSASLKELAELLGTTKSCLNHRMRKLMELCEEENGL